MRVLIFLIAACELLSAADTGLALWGSIPSTCGVRGLLVTASGGGHVYPAKVGSDGKFVFLRPVVLGNFATYKVKVTTQHLAFPPKDPYGPVSPNVRTDVRTDKGTVLSCPASAFVRSPYVVASNGFWSPMPNDPPPEPGAFHLKVMTAPAGLHAGGSSLRFGRATATIFAIGGSVEQPRAIDRITATADGSLYLDPAKYKKADTFLVSLEKTGFEPNVVTTASLSELPTVPTYLDPADADSRPPVLAINESDASRGRSALASEIDHLPIGGRRSIDSLALLNPGVSPAPQAGTGYGPGIGPTIGSAGEVSVDGVRPRMNNFVTDGADNNDEAVGVRRQGFVFAGAYALESIREFQLLTTLYDALYGRASGGQFNVLTRIGTPVARGKLYGYLGSAAISARDYFNADYSSNPIPGSSYYRNGGLQQASYSAGAKDPRTDGAAGFLVESPLTLNTYLSLNAEWRGTSAQRTTHFSVPRVAERGFNGTGASGLVNQNGAVVAPASQPGDAIFSLFPFPNNPTGPYGANDFATVLPADERGLLYALKVDHSFTTGGLRHHLTGAFSGTTESSTLPTTGGALYSTLSPNVHTDSGTVFFDTNIGAHSANGLRVSAGQANFIFGRERDPLLLASRFDGNPFLLNRPLLLNESDSSAASYAGRASYTAGSAATDSLTGPLGEVNVAGYSGLGADVFRFPQARRDRTIQISDAFTHYVRGWTFVGGADSWFFRYQSTVNPNAAPYLQYNGQVDRSAPASSLKIATPADLVAAGLPALALRTNTTLTDDNLTLRRNQTDLFVNANGRVSPHLALSLGVRAEFQQLPASDDGRFEKPFDQATFDKEYTDAINNCGDPRNPFYQRCSVPVDAVRAALIGNFQSVFGANRFSLDPRAGFAWSPGKGRTVIRGGFGKYTTQFPAVVLDESRSTFPASYTLNYADSVLSFGPIANTAPLASIPTATLPASNRLTGGTGDNPFAYLANQFLGAAVLDTRPAEHLANAYALHSGLTVERTIGNAGILSVGYVLTSGRHLLRELAPSKPGVAYTDLSGPSPTLGWVAAINGPATVCKLMLSVSTQFAYTCPRVANILIETGASSSYHSLQSEFRGHYQRASYGAALTWAHSIDDASDFFDTRSGYALPQNSSNARTNRASSDFDVRLRWVGYFDWQPAAPSGSRWLRDWRLSGIYTLQSGMPFTVNTVYDSNLDGLLNDRLGTAVGLDRHNADRRVSLSLLPGTAAAQLIPSGNGMVGRNTFEGPGINNLDLSLARTFPIGERPLVVRLEGFNVWNHAQFGVPVRLFGAPGFGTSFDTAAGNRRLQVNVQFSF